MGFDESIELRKIETESERSRLSAQEQSLVEEHLGFALDYFGYRDSAASESSGLNNEGTV